MTTVAFAADKDNVLIGYDIAVYGGDVTTTDDYYVLDDGTAKKHTSGNLEGGDEIALPLVYWQDKDGDGEVDLTDDSFVWYTDTDDYKKPKIYTDWRIGSADAEIRTVKFELADGTTKYIYAAVVTVPDNTSNKEADLEGKIMVGRTKSAAEDANAVDLGITYSPNGATKVSNFDGGTIDSDTGIVSFADDAGEIDIEFGDDTAMFTVDVTGQKKLNLAWNTDFDKEFASKYDYANIDFVTFEGEPSFNKTGTLYIYADEDSYIYEVTADGAKALKAEWDEDYEAWTFKTRTLTSYAISDVELDEQTVTEDKTDDSSKTETETGKPNPDTGR
ncbi:MAG: hypothetical protein KH009_08005 [Clostridiales bacterium]|nr:hypothetical protein [Clostridiales bacterium]